MKTTNTLKLIKNKEEHKQILDRVNELIALDPAADTPEANELDILYLILSKYEEERFNIASPDPIDAIKFRMEQNKLTQKDLIPFIGSKSKVSEVLSGKSELTLKMIRGLHAHLGIPAEVLLQNVSIKNFDEYNDIEFEKFPIEEMAETGIFNGFDITHIKDKAEEAMRFLFQKVGGIESCPSACYRKNDSSRINAKSDSYALWGWRLAVLSKALEKKTSASFDIIKTKTNKGFFSGLTALSTLKYGHTNAVEYLANHGIILVFVKHFKNTYIDGISFITREGIPVIGISLRYNRIDSFWFTLLHELAHILKHLRQGECIADDMSLRGAHGDSETEKEADSFAEEKLLPNFSIDTSEYYSVKDIEDIARKHNVHPSIVAGRIQHAINNYKMYANIVNSDKIIRPWCVD